jgi:hypothetical protein
MASLKKTVSQHLELFFKNLIQSIPAKVDIPNIQFLDHQFNLQFFKIIFTIFNLLARKATYVQFGHWVKYMGFTLEPSPGFSSSSLDIRITTSSALRCVSDERLSLGHLMAEVCCVCSEECTLSIQGLWTITSIDPIKDSMGQSRRQKKKFITEKKEWSFSFLLFPEPTTTMIVYKKKLRTKALMSHLTSRI